MTQKRELSSGWTPILKVAFPSLFYGTSTLMIVLAAYEGQYLVAAVAFVLGFLILGTLIYLAFVRLMVVHTDGEHFFISNYFKTIKVPLADLVDVNETWIINIHPIWLTFRKRTDFGQTILFMPSYDVTATFSTHPLTEELRGMIKK